nr:hypothetical protein [uncultured Desulfobacter sp.]
MIFEYVHNINALADATPGVLRLSMDAKAAIKVGPFSRGGYNRYGLRACDHDFEPDAVLKLFGIFLPATDEPFFYFRPMIGIKPSKIWFRSFIRIQGVTMGAY